jgi:hypothetical protein
MIHTLLFACFQELLAYHHDPMPKVGIDMPLERLRAKD